VGTFFELFPVDIVNVVSLGDGTFLGSAKSNAFVVEIERTNDETLGQREVLGEPAKSGIVL
jgi:hypothetical protein